MNSGNTGWNPEDPSNSSRSETEDETGGELEKMDLAGQDRVPLK